MSDQSDRELSRSIVALEKTLESFSGMFRETVITLKAMESSLKNIDNNIAKLVKLRPIS